MSLIYIPRNKYMYLLAKFNEIEHLTSTKGLATGTKHTKHPTLNWNTMTNQTYKALRYSGTASSPFPLLKGLQRVFLSSQFTGSPQSQALNILDRERQSQTVCAAYTQVIELYTVASFKIQSVLTILACVRAQCAVKVKPFVIVIRVNRVLKKVVHLQSTTMLTMPPPRNIIVTHCLEVTCGDQ